MKLRHCLLPLLVVTAVSAIVLPMQVEQPLFAFKPTHIDNRMFKHSLVRKSDVRQMAHMQETGHRYTAVARQKHPFFIADSQAATAVEVPEAWVIVVDEKSTETAASEQVASLNAQGLTAFYQMINSQYQVMVGPEIQKSKLVELREKLAETEPDAVIERYLPQEPDNG